MRWTILIFMAIGILVLGNFVFAAEATDSAAISISLINQDPDPAISGDVVELRLGVENTGGGDAKDLVMELMPEYPFELVSGSNQMQEIGTIKGFQSGADMKIIRYTIRVNKDATAGTYELKLKYYSKGSSSSIQKTFSIVISSREGAEIIHIDKSVLVPGKQSSVRFTINNVGNAPLRNMKFYWQNSDNVVLPVGSDNTKYIKYIDIGESADLEYQVIADTTAVAGLYKLDLYLTYDDPVTSEPKTVTTIAGIYVGGGTDFDVAFSESSSGTTSFTIANIGSNPASSVSIIIPQQRLWSVTGSNSVIIGNLNKGDYTVASFKLQSGSSGFNRSARQSAGSPAQQQAQFAQRNTTSSPGMLKIQIAYTDTLGERLIVDKDISLSLQNLGSSSVSGLQAGRMTATRQGFLSKYSWQIVAVLLVAAGIFVYARFKKGLWPAKKDAGVGRRK
jgi:hypothetical protein